MSAALLRRLHAACLHQKYHLIPRRWPSLYNARLVEGWYHGVRYTFRYGAQHTPGAFLAGRAAVIAAPERQSPHSHPLNIPFGCKGAYVLTLLQMCSLLTLCPGLPACLQVLWSSQPDARRP